MFLELHLVQNFVPANLNRDDSNNPKESEFGGYRRARVSSQCIKRTIRISDVFKAHTGVESAKRIDYMLAKLKRLIKAQKPKIDDEEMDIALRTFIYAYAGGFHDKKRDKTSILLFISDDEVQQIADVLLADWETLVKVAKDHFPKDGKEKNVSGEVKKKIKSALKGRKKDGPLQKIINETQNRTGAPDIAMFGRMLADTPDVSLPAACQVANAISTNKVAMDVDFFTAMVDRDPEFSTDDEADEELGAGMMGLTGYNSACFYRYARIDFRQLAQNLDGNVDLARRTVKGFMDASLTEVPSGKQNSFGHNNPPSFALAVVRTDGMGWSLANAFQNPVRPQRYGGNSSGLLEPSVAKLDEYWECLREAYGDDTLVKVSAFGSHPDLPLTHLKRNLVKAEKDEEIGKIKKSSRNIWLETVVNALEYAPE